MEQHQRKAPEGSPPSAARRLLQVLWGTPEGADARWTNTGGGCMAIEIYGDGWEVLATDERGPLTDLDLESDDARTGWCVGHSWRAADGTWVQDEELLLRTDDLLDVDAVAAVMVAHARHADP